MTDGQSEVCETAGPRDTRRQLVAVVAALLDALSAGIKQGGLTPAECQAALDEAHVLYHAQPPDRCSREVADICRKHPEAVGLREAVEYLARAVDELSAAVWHGKTKEKP